MYQRVTAFLLHWLRVPPQPQAPHGNPASLRVFQAGRNYYRLKLTGWALAQSVALAGIAFWVTLFIDIEFALHARRLSHQKPISPTESRNFADYLEKIGAADKTPPVIEGPSPDGTTKAKPRSRARITGYPGFKRMIVETAVWLPLWAFPLLWIVKLSGIAAYLVQLPVTLVITRLDYEMRWYMVTDRSLRIRHGIWTVAESTMSFANIQQVVVSQGPFQRLLGLGDVRVESAGGGGGGSDSHGNPKAGDDLHQGLFHSVTNASEIRDLILDRLRQFRESGLGDPDEKTAAAPAVPTVRLLSAAREFAAEARALRAAL